VADMMAIERGRLSLSRITYICDLRQASASIIPLGVMAEIVIGRVRALGLIARTRLEPNEAERVGRILRPQLETPFEFLKKELDWAFASAPRGCALAELSQRFSESLLFETPRAEEWRKVLPRGRAAAEPVLAYLRQRRDDDFWLLLTECESGENIIPSEDATKLAA
jgi:hypothetical protein